MWQIFFLKRGQSFVPKTIRNLSRELFSWNTAFSIKLNEYEHLDLEL